MFVCQPAVREQESTAGTGVLMQQKKSVKTLEIFRNNRNLYIDFFFTKQMGILLQLLHAPL